MGQIRYVECKNCGYIHYVVDKEKAASIKKGLPNEVSSRDMSYCFKCGSKNNFGIMSTYYVNVFAFGYEIPPILIDYGKLEQSAKIET